MAQGPTLPLGTVASLAVVHVIIGPMKRTYLSRRAFVAGAGTMPAAAAQIPAPPQQFPNPDLANLHEFVDWVSKENGPRLSFLEKQWKSLEEWKHVARPLFQRHLLYEPKPAPLSAEVIVHEEREGFRLETVRIRATSAYDIPAKVLIPTKRSGPVPGIVALHCHSGKYVWGHEKAVSDPQDPPPLLKFRDEMYGRPYAEVLARRGYVVLAIDAFYFGERRLCPELIDPVTAPYDIVDGLRDLATLKPRSAEWFQAVNVLCSRYEHLTAKNLFTAGTTWPGILVWDDMRSVSYLCSRPEVDSRRIGCLGLSIGGLRAAYLVASDPRIRVACVTGWMTKFHEQLRNHLRNHTWMVYIPGLYSSLDLPDLAGLMAPGALLVQQCRRDRLYTLAAMRGAVDKLTKIYAKAGIPERFRGTFWDVPHSFRPEMQEEAFAWFKQWI
jgi:dienelactone hydrolase